MAMGGMASGLSNFAMGMFRADQAKQNAAARAAVLRASGQNAMAAANYSAKIMGVNLVRNLDTLSRQFAKAAATGRAQQTATGLNLTSKSYLIRMNEGYTMFDKQVLSLRNQTEEKQKQVIMQAQISAANAENQARFAIFQGQQQADSAMLSGAMNLARSFGGISGGFSGGGGGPRNSVVPRGDSGVGIIGNLINL